MRNYKELIRDWTRKFWSKELTELDNYRETNEMALKKIEQNKILIQDNEQLKKENDYLIKVYKYIPEEIETLAYDIKTNYPKANVVYKGYNIQLKGKVIKPEIRVEDFIQVMSSHIIWCRQHGFHIQKYLHDYSDLSFGEVMNKLMFDIFKTYISRKTYKLDSQLYGFDEQWAPVLETWYLKQMDCENSTNECMALFEAAGLDGILRNFFWNVCGNTSLGGHSTLYAYDVKNDTWKHLETTATSTSAASFYKLPDKKDTGDKLNITSVWWSFNSDIARHTFKTNADVRLHKKRDKFRDIVIKRDN